MHEKNMPHLVGLEKWVALITKDLNGMGPIFLSIGENGQHQRCNVPPDHRKKPQSAYCFESSLCGHPLYRLVYFVGSPNGHSIR